MISNFQAGKRERRDNPSAYINIKIGRQVGEQVLHYAMYLLLIDKMVIVQKQTVFLVFFGKTVHQLSNHILRHSGTA